MAKDGLRLLALTAMIAALATLAPGTGRASQVRDFPPPPPEVSPVAGAIDFHVHSGPDVFGRSVDDLQVAQLARRHGMRALVLKNHVTATADRAALVARQVPGIALFGGVVLNRAVGGINAAAVEWMVRMEGGRGKVVWLPTFDAAHHLATFGEGEGGLIVARDGVVLPETEAVLKVIAREDLVLQTGHVSPAEALAVIARARELGVRHIVVTHAMARVPGLSREEMRRAADLGAHLELDFITHLMGPEAHLAWMRAWRQVSIADMAEAIRAIGAEHFVLGSDLGQAGNPVHPDGYRMLVTGLGEAGISDAEIALMMAATPARLLGLEAAP